MKKRITALLKKNPGLKARQIARELGVDRKEVSSFLVKNLDAFVQDSQAYTWSLVQSASFELEITSGGLWVTQLHFERALKKSGSPLDADHGHVVIKVVNEQRVLLCAAARIIALCNQLVSSNKKVELDLSNNEQTLSYLDRAAFFDRLHASVEVKPYRPKRSAAEQYMANNSGLVELLEIRNDINVPERIKESFIEKFGDEHANKLFTVVGESVCNVEDHSNTVIPGFAGLQYYGRAVKKTIVVVISDSGDGICKTLRPGLEKYFPDVAKKFDPSTHAADPKLIIYAMVKGGLSSLGSDRGAGLNATHLNAEKLDAIISIRQESFSVRLVYKSGALDQPSWELNLPRLAGTQIVFEFKLDNSSISG
ncbi:ATPase [Pseudomonas citronellolis]|uniref:ATPase n=1 Tax=Pseudomonas citronellolis TaxID=53408 RepID=UPI0021BE6ECC|nr:ATPase [Pseudomonas citronellolis]UXJ50307.1 ATPase [Pseudomonas citronellolis]